MALTKADFAERLLNELGIDKRKAKNMVELFFEEIKGSLEQGKTVNISGFGKFTLRDKVSRPGRPKNRRRNPYHCQVCCNLQSRAKTENTSRAIVRR